MEKEPLLSDFRISTDKSELNIDMIYDFLFNSYWAAGISREVVIKSIENSVTFGIYKNKHQIGFARVITDKATFAYLADVFVLPAYHGIGLSKRLMTYILNYPDLKHLRSIMLATRDAHGLYAKFGFKPIDQLQKYMILKSNQ